MLSLPTQQTLPHSAHWFMRGPGPNFRAAKFTDPVDGEVLGYTIAGVWGRADRTIWTDGRAHPSARSRILYGFSTRPLPHSTIRRSSVSGSGGLVRWWSKPASRERRLSSSCPQPVRATRTTRSPSCSRIWRAAS